MSLALLPQPRKIEMIRGFFKTPIVGKVGISAGELRDAAEDTANLLFPRRRLAAAVSGQSDHLSLILVPNMGREEYRLRVLEDRIVIESGAVVGVRHAIETLRQIVEQSEKGRIPRLDIHDWPEFADRGLYYDLCRGRVPKTESLWEQADLLSQYKINQLQYYVKHTFTFRNHPRIGRACGSLTPEDILGIDGLCRRRNIEFVPSIASFGHMDRILQHQPYRHMAEDRGVGQYDIQPEGRWLHALQKGWSISPANPESYAFIDSLWSEFLPLFQSKRFNVCCDETWDLGLGQTRELCEKLGKGRVYLNHILKLKEMAERHGREIMFWGDIIHHYTELIPELPKDITVLDWGYERGHNVDRIQAFRQVGCPFYACPGTSSWSRLFPHLNNARVNIDKYVKAARANGASGILNTDWGDGGHFNFMELSWPGYLFGAEQAWNPDADQKSFSRRFVKSFLKSDNAGLARAMDVLGMISTKLWFSIYFARVEGDIFQKRHEEALVKPDGSERKVVLNKKETAKLLEMAEEVRQTLETESGLKTTDPHEVLPYWLFETEALIHAIRKYQVFGPDGSPTMADRCAFKEETRALERHFVNLWMARNRISEIRITLDKYKRVADSY